MEKRRIFIDFKAINEKREKDAAWEEFMRRSTKCGSLRWEENKEEKVKYAKCAATGKSCRQHLCPLNDKNKENEHSTK